MFLEKNNNRYTSCIKSKDFFIERNKNKNQGSRICQGLILIIMRIEHDRNYALLCDDSVQSAEYNYDP